MVETCNEKQVWHLSTKKILVKIFVTILQLHRLLRQVGWMGYAMYMQARYFLLLFVNHLSHLVTKPAMWLCGQRRLRSAWASAQSDQSLRYALNGWLRVQAFFMQTAKTLIRLGGCPGWSESSLGAHSLCWFCHEVAHLSLFVSFTTFIDVQEILFSLLFSDGCSCEFGCAC